LRTRSLIRPVVVGITSRWKALAPSSMPVRSCSQPAALLHCSRATVSPGEAGVTVPLTSALLPRGMLGTLSWAATELSGGVAAAAGAASAAAASTSTPSASVATRRRRARVGVPASVRGWA
jgi:hypothetical protein